MVAASGGKGLLTRLFEIFRKSPLDDIPRDPDKPYIEFVMGSLEVSPLKNTHLVAIIFVSADPELSSRVANAVANSYIEFNQSARYDTTAQASEFIASQASELKKQITDLEARLNQYGEEKEIIGLDDKESITS